ncbi:hypothetical protein [Burkholderia multivorans]|uniref:hypothetical protein n=1 Tax=Burkholderia multivorans TaxID=87883 RepID=UPI0013BE935A|nr:hypothetical protein [Burkholderia multivorans]
MTIFGDFLYAPGAWAIVMDSSIDSLMNRIALTGAIMLFARATIVVWGSRDDAIVHRARVDQMPGSPSRMFFSESKSQSTARTVASRALTTISLAISISVAVCGSSVGRVDGFVYNNHSHLQKRSRPPPESGHVR